MPCHCFCIKQLLLYLLVPCIRVNLPLDHFSFSFPVLIYFWQFIFSLGALCCHQLNCLLLKVFHVEVYFFILYPGIMQAFFIVAKYIENLAFLLLPLLPSPWRCWGGASTGLRFSWDSQDCSRAVTVLCHKLGLWTFIPRSGRKYVQPLLCLVMGLWRPQSY